MLVIGGFNGRALSDVELWINSSDNECDPPDLTYKVYHHATVSTSRGFITCGGKDDNWKTTSKCQLNGESSSFPPMIEKRSHFGMLNVNNNLYSIGGGGSLHTMETIDLNGGTPWKKEEMPFGVSSHCVVNIGSKILVIGGFFFPIGGGSGYVSKKLLLMK